MDPSITLPSIITRSPPATITSPHSPLKRPIDSLYGSSPSPPPPTKHPKLQQRKQTCAVCHSPSPLNQFKKFATCRNSNNQERCNKTCNFCWTKLIKIKAIDDPAAKFWCDGCGGVLDESQVMRFFNENEGDIKHFKFCENRQQALTNNERECTRADCRSSQVHEPEERLFTCQSCGAEDCTACNRPSHPNETCTAYQTRMDLEHGHEEEATLQAIANGYKGLEEIGRLGNEGLREKHPTPCPGCGVLIERGEGCNRVRCIRCGLEFCIKAGCGARYLGAGSVREFGKAAHATTCGHHHRAKEDKRFKKERKEGAMKSTAEIEEEEVNDDGHGAVQEGPESADETMDVDVEEGDLDEQWKRVIEKWMALQESEEELSLW